MEFANKSGTKVIAEGIETLEELRFLQDFGAQMGQCHVLDNWVKSVLKPFKTN